MSGCFGTSRLVMPLVVDYFALRRLVVDYVACLISPLVVNYFASAARLGVLARRATRRRLLRLRRVSGCLGMSRGSSRGSSSTTSPTPHVRLLRHVAWLVA
jgi:hypothetical protein